MHTYRLQAKEKNKKIPSAIWFFPLIWSLLGFIEVFSASRYVSEVIRGNHYYLLIFHIAWVVLGLAALVVIQRLAKVERLAKVSKLLYMINIVLLLAAYFFSDINGARRWIKILGFTLQPSEFLKITLPLYAFFNIIVPLENHLQHKRFQFKNDKQLQIILKKGLIWIGFGLLIVLLQPDLSTVAIIGVQLLLMYLTSNLPYKLRVLAIGTVITLVLGSLLFVFYPYRLQRLKVYTEFLRTGKVHDPYGAGNQLLNILIAVGSGGLWGKGLGNSTQMGGYLVESTAITDSIGAVLLQELGFFLGTLMIVSYVIWGAITYTYLVQKQKKFKGVSLRPLFLAYIGVIITQALVHFSVNVGLLPLTGVALPFVSYGGSATLTSFIILGLILAFAKHF